MQFVGLYWWMKRGPNADNDLPVIRFNRYENIIIAFGILLCAGINGYIMTKTDASFPYIDALTTWMSIFAQVLMIKKVLESWVIWIAMDAIAIPVYFAKELYVVSGLYVVFFILATMGLIAWYRDWKQNDDRRKFNESYI